MRVHGLRVWDPENKTLVVPAWLAVELRVQEFKSSRVQEFKSSRVQEFEFKSSRVQEFVSNIVKSSDNCGPIVKRVPAGYEPMIKRVPAI